MKPSTKPLRARPVVAAEPKPAAGPRKHLCKHCKTPFVQYRSFESWCSPECGLEVANATLAKQERKRDRERKQALKRHADWLREVQTAMNAWVRYRDRELPCICCGKWAADDALSGGGWDAGHYLSRGSHPHLRFDVRNVFRQRKGCNRPGGTTAASFRLGVIARIGLAAVEALEADHTPRKYSIAELQAIKAHYVAALKKLKVDDAKKQQVIASE